VKRQPALDGKTAVAYTAKLHEASHTVQLAAQALDPDLNRRHPAADAIDVLAKEMGEQAKEILLHEAIKAHREES
jgi:hypothetical protein